MSDKLTLVLKSQRSNQRLSQYDIDEVMLPFDHAQTLVTAFHEERQAIAKNFHLNGKGKAAATIKAAEAKQTSLAEWNEARLKGIDADLLEQRASLLPATDRPDPRRVDLMSSQLLKFAPNEIAVLYNSASEDERRVMEAASAATGRVPVKIGSGLEWRNLLDPDVVAAGIMATADATNPAGAAKVRELTEIRAMQVTIAGVAASEIRDALSEYKLDV
jgi:hypothetical protein